MDLVSSGTLNIPGVRRALRPPSGSETRIDLTDTDFLEPCGLAAVAAIADLALKSGRKVVFDPPRSFGVRNYLARMKVGQFFDECGIRHSLPQVRENDLARDLQELVAFSGEFNGEKIANFLHDKISSLGAPDAARVVHESVIELTANIEHHAEVERGFAAIQTMPGKREIIFAIGDSGIGIGRSMRKQNVALSDLEAVQTAIIMHQSGTGEVGRGVGLADIIAQVTGLGGRVDIVTAGAWLWRSRTALGDIADEVDSFPGTLIQGRLSF